ncbi:MAG: alpha/beta hydrolase [Bacteroidia bacterium]|nr:alpha/beta hydrolase [Bacteroidia bacterium]
MKKLYVTIGAVLLVLAIGAYFFLSAIFSGPLYLTGSLKSEAAYAHLLKEAPDQGKENYFQLNDDISLYYTTQGSGKPVLIVHGGPGIPYDQHWAGLDSLGQEYRYYYYHQRGCGNSSRPFDKFPTSNFYENMKSLNEHLGLPAQIADIEQLRRILKQDKIVLMGHSFGGFIASLYALEFPERVEALVLITPAEVLKMPSDGDGLYGVVEKKLPEEYVEEYRSYMERVFDYSKLFEMSEEELVVQNKEFIRFYNLATNNSATGEVKGIGGWIQNACFLSMGMKHDYSEALRNIKAPTLLMHGKEDLIPLSSLQLYRENIPHAELIEIEGAGHFPFVEKPRLFSNAIAGFFEKYGI